MPFFADDGRCKPSPRFIDESGKTYGRLTVCIAVSGEFSGRQWLCKCSCGGSIVVRGPHLRNGNTVSCGCKSAEELANHRTTHGLSDLPEYHVWESALDRCRNPNNRQYGDYGGRGIRMFDQWRNDFAAFYAHVGPRPSEQHTLERINNDAGYEPGNLKWADRVEQNNNRRPRGSGIKARRASGRA